MCQGKEFVVFLLNKDEMGVEETREEMKERESARKMYTCLRLEGTSEQHKSTPKHFINTGTLGRERQSSRSALTSIVKRATEL